MPVIHKKKKKTFGPMSSTSRNDKSRQERLERGRLGAHSLLLQDMNPDYDSLVIWERLKAEYKLVLWLVWYHVRKDRRVGH